VDFTLLAGAATSGVFAAATFFAPGLTPDILWRMQNVFIEAANVLHVTDRARRNTESDQLTESLAEQTLLLNVWLSDRLGLNVRVAYQVFYDRAFSSQFTASHRDLPTIQRQFSWVFHFAVKDLPGGIFDRAFEKTTDVYVVLLSQQLKPTHFNLLFHTKF
jgi:response regulator of citrate/malate metabolism